VLEAIKARKQGSTDNRSVKEVELDAILAVPQGFGDDVPIDPDFHARRLPEHTWRKSPDHLREIEGVIQLHRLREIIALAGFTRFEAITPDINGEYDSDVKGSQIAWDPEWFPAVENRGEGVFIQLRAATVSQWLDRPAVVDRINGLREGHNQWNAQHGNSREFPEGPYILLHTLSHLLIQSLAMRCGYPASAIRERIYADRSAQRYGILLFTGSPDADGTLGGLVHEARNIEAHLLQALRSGRLCSNDPICSQHDPGKSKEQRWLQGAACHGCALAAETSCEMRNEYLDRALVVPVIGRTDAAFFQGVEA
jgi:hypothetical protein